MAFTAKDMLLSYWNAANENERAEFLKAIAADVQPKRKRKAADPEPAEATPAPQ